MSGKDVMCFCACPCENYILTDIYDRRPLSEFICDDCKKGMHQEEEKERPKNKK